MKILVVGMSQNKGGIESVIHNYFCYFNKDNIQFDFLSHFQHIAFEDDFKKFGSKMYYIPTKHTNYFAYKKAITTFFKENSKFYDAIWVNLLQLTNIDYLKLAKRYGIKHRIIHSHNNKSGYKGVSKAIRGCIHEWNKLRLNHYATDFWACSEDAANFFYSRTDKKESRIIYNAINVEDFKFSEKDRLEIRKKYHLENTIVIGNIGRLQMQKNQLFLISTMQKLIKKIPNVKLVLVGDGPDKELLEAKINKFKLENNVIMVGLQDNVQPYLSSFDLFVFPSLFEGLGVAALESEANGVPVIASTGVPKNVKINSNFLFADLNKGVNYWAELVQKVVKKDSSRISYDVIKDEFSRTHFDIKKESNILEKLFLDMQEC